jgi:4-hydroxybenzoate polyprenyltransferase
VTAAPAAAQPAQLRARLWEYQKERFPVAGFVPLISAFVFSSAAFSRLSRGLTEFIPWPRFAVGAYTTIALFFLLRVLDEHKDQDVDRRYRPELPVPRGLVTLGELRVFAAGVLVLALLLNALVVPRALIAMVPIGIWIALMTREFFVRDWLRAHPAAYLLSHMVVLPVIDVYTTGLDWLAEGVEPPPSLMLFLGVTFANGILLEIGRKVRAPADEREGVDTYTAAWGRPRAGTAWALAFISSLLLALQASAAAGASPIPVLLFLVPGMLAVLTGIAFTMNGTRRHAQGMEVASQLWPLVTYLLLGGAPFVIRWLGRTG